MSDQALTHTLGFLLLVAGGAWVIFATLRMLQRRRPDLAIREPVIAGGIGRLAVLGAVSLTGAGSSLRGGDESFFYASATSLAHTPFGTADWFSEATGHLNIAVMALQAKLFGASMDAMRVTQVVLTMIGLLCVCAAVHDLAGPRAARLAAWLVMLEPANLFFSSILHKEPLIYLGAGLVCLGCVRVWRAIDAWGLGLIAVGCYIAITTRSYAGYFLLAGAVFACLHASLIHMGGRRTRAIPLLIGTTAGIALAVGPVQHIADQQLVRLQVSQRANTNDPHSHLGLEPLDYSSRWDLIKNLPRRLFDVTVKPYVWQVANASQQLGVVGSLAALAGFLALLRLLLQGGRTALRRVAPLLYPGAFLYSAYAISAGNAGTSFRYRTAILVIVIAAVAVLWTDARRIEEEPGTVILEPGSSWSFDHAVLDSPTSGSRLSV